MKRPYEVGDNVMYSGNGICKISDIRSEKFTGLDEKLYYVMDPIFEKGARFFLPVGNASRLRPLLTDRDIRAIIEKTENLDADWISDDSRRAEVFEAILQSGDIAKALWLVKILHLHKRAVHSQNKKFHACDEAALVKAEKTIIEEFAFVLGLEKGEVIPYITQYIARREENDPQVL